ncbi:MAG: hypothetical protein GY715_03570 [Planctomycetes bacterium]|nr:hypothetical protein [Planctomycetota bacterium]
MTRTVPEPAAFDPRATHPGIELRWTATVRGTGDRPGLQRRTLVVTLSPVDREHAVLEAWIETPHGLRPVVARHPVVCPNSVHDGFLHADAVIDGRRVLAVSLPLDMDAGPPPRLRSVMFIQSALLADAGFAPGGFDPPTARLRKAKIDAVSA